MAYTIKSPKDFKKDLDNYLEKHPLELSYEESIISNFSSSNLSDLYKLFLDLEDSELDVNLYNKLKEIMNKNFSIDANDVFKVTNGSIFPFYLSENHIHQLENIIKDKYLIYVSGNNLENIDEDELYNLSLIVNKVFPEVFLKLIKTPDSDIERDQAFIKNKILSTIEHWHLHNSIEAEEENRDIIGAFYITTKKLYPDFNVYIPGRIKSTKSSISNIDKESVKSLSSLIPSDLSVGLTDNDIEDQFNLENANTDFSGFTVVLSNTDDTLHFEKGDPKSSEILRLRKIREDNISFIHSLENFLFEDDNNSFSNIELLQIKIDLLIRLRESTYEECVKEYQNTSFSELLKENIKKYNEELEKPYGEYVSDDETWYTLELDDIYQLIDELKKRVHDKYQAKLLEIAIPDILNDEIFSETLKIKSSFVKNVRKKNGFCSSYYSIQTADGRKIELQAQSKKRFEDSKNGPSDHSSLPNKEIDILHFFEPVDPNCDDKQFKSLLNILNNTPIAVKNNLYKTLDSQLSPTDKRLKKKIKIAEQNIKLKDLYEVENRLPDGTTYTSKYTLDQYLPIFAEYISPKLMSISSHHTRFNTSVAAYNKKSLISGFTEVLLKHDYTTCLAQQLIDKLETLIPNDKSEVSRNGIIKRSSKRYNSTKSSDIDERQINKNITYIKYLSKKTGTKCIIARTGFLLFNSTNS